MRRTKAAIQHAEYVKDVLDYKYFIFDFETQRFATGYESKEDAKEVLEDYSYAEINTYKQAALRGRGDALAMFISKCIDFRPVQLKGGMMVQAKCEHMNAENRNTVYVQIGTSHWYEEKSNIIKK